ncbi:hypothetical protein CQA49_02685 [Helicobacter sp. MIT 00-7814]|nr:hypothetical protein CQA37_04375 [Helicobacter sp. MIT 99-10781]RDU56131.1 hypothetical protein CQA49_02685 [Helicobacter sp. MIT 00-7814]
MGKALTKLANALGKACARHFCQLFKNTHYNARFYIKTLTKRANIFNKEFSNEVFSYFSKYFYSIARH